MVNHVSEWVYKLSYQPNCTRLKTLFLICLTEHLVIQIYEYILAILYNLNISSFEQLHKISIYNKVKWVAAVTVLHIDNWKSAA